MKLKISLILLPLLTALNAHAINCSKASTDIEKAICASESHLADDRKISDLFNKAKKSTKYPGNVTRSQLAWVAERNESCNNTQELDKCIASNTQMRIKEFSATEDSKEGLAFARILGSMYSKDEEGVLNFSFSYLLFSPADTPQKIAFNNIIEKSFDPGSNALNKLPQNSDINATCDYDSQTTHHSLLFFSTRYLAIYSGEDSMGCGAAHPNHDGHNLHFDMASGKLLTYPDIFQKKSLSPLIDQCIKNIAAQRENTEAEYREIYGESVKNGFATLDRWSFSANGATIEFPPYSAGSYSEGFISCEFTKEKIFPYLTESFLQSLKAPKG